MINQNDIIYFLFTDRFYNGDKNNDFNVNPDDPQGFHGGDFAGIVKKIPYLKQLGVTALWITPVCQNIEYTEDPKFRNRAYHGYWALDFEKVDRHLYTVDPEIPAGDRKYLRQLSDTLHENGIKLILDIVINHTGYEHPWQKEKPWWFHPPGYDDDIRRYLYGLPDLDLSHPDVIDYFTHNIIDWIREGRIDGIRMDAVKHIDKPFWYHLKASLRGACPGISIFGEAFDYDPVSIAFYQDFYDFDSMIDFPLKNAMNEVFINEAPFYRIARPRLSDDETPGALDMDLKYNNPYRLITFLDNHDMPRFITELLNHFGYDGDGRYWAINTYLEAYTFLLTCRGIPQIFYGDEIGMEGGNDPDNRRDMPWNIMNGSKPDPDGSPECRQIYDYFEKLIRVRNENPALQYGSLLTLWVDDFVMIYLRYIDNNIVICAFNNGRYPMQTHITVPYHTNANIPTRIREKLASLNYIYSALNDYGKIIFTQQGFEIQLKGKSGDIFAV
jgi:alpha-amylase